MKLLTKEELKTYRDIVEAGIKIQPQNGKEILDHIDAIESMLGEAREESLMFQQGFLAGQRSTQKRFQDSKSVYRLPDWVKELLNPIPYYSE